MWLKQEQQVFKELEPLYSSSENPDQLQESIFISYWAGYLNLGILHYQHSNPQNMRKAIPFDGILHVKKLIWPHSHLLATVCFMLIIHVVKATSLMI